jgi:integrase
LKLTATTIRALELPPGMQDKTYFDDDLAGFGVRLREGGSKTFVIQYKVGAKHRRMPLGSVTAIDLSKARSTAKDLLAAVRLGQDPAGEKLAQRHKGEETFGAFLPRYLARQRARLKPRSMLEIDRFLAVYAKAWHGRQVQTIDRRAVAIRLGDIGEKHGPGAANRFRAAVSTYFNWLAREGILESNVVSFTNKAPEGGSRERVLMDDEIAAIWRAAGDDQYGAIIRLLILTGCRRDEVGGLCWSEIDLDDATITLPGARTKNRREHIVPLTPSVVEILKAQPRRTMADGTPRDLVFGYGERAYSGWSKSRRELDARVTEQAGAPILDWVVHDLRRSISTTMHERFGIQPHIVEAVLNHVSGHKRGVAGVYNKSTYADQKRIALEKWADHVETVVTGKQSTAVIKRLHRHK